MLTARNGARRRRVFIRHLLGIGAALVLGEVFTLAHVINPAFLPPLHVILWTIVKICVDGDFLAALLNTTWSWLAGLVLSVVIGVVIGIVKGRSRFFDRSTGGLFDLLRPIPSVVLVPLGIVSLGQGETLKILLVIYAAVWPIIFNTAAGMRQVTSLQIETARVFKISQARVVRNVVWHNVLPFVATGIRIAAPLGLVLAISVELLSGSTQGIGAWLLARTTGSLRPDLVFGGTAVAGLLGLATNAIIVAAERRLLWWHVSFRAETA